MAAHLARIERINPKVNAIVTLVAERAMADAAKADEQTARGGTLGVLHGLPVAHKDLVDTAGIRTTRGSRFYSDNVPTRDALIVTRLRAAGAMTCGKTNTPEFGAGSQTFNEVFGATRNPYDLTKTCGGSSGGAAVAVACGLVPIADGSDTGGSLRNPPAFCNVVGLRPSPGRVPGEGGSWAPLLGARVPSAGRSRDVALMLSAIAGPDPRSPLPMRRTARASARRSIADFKGVRVAWWKGLGGIPFEPEIRSVVDANRRVFEDLGCIVEEAEPDFADVGEAFRVLRFTANSAQYAPLIRQRAEWVKDEIKYEVDSGASATRAPTSGGRSPGRHGCTTRAGSSSNATTTSCCRSRRCRRSTSPRGIQPRSPASRWRTTSTGCARAGTSRSWRTPRSPCPAGSRRPGCRSGCRSSAATATSGACCSWPTRSSRRHVTPRGARALLNA